MNGIRLGLAVLAVTASSGLACAHSGSLEDQMACTPDVYRLCASQIPDEDAIVACLKSNRAALTPACSKVFAKPSPGASGQNTQDGD